MDSKFPTLKFKFFIILSFKTTFCSNNFILLKLSDNSSLAPSPVIKSLITNFAIGFFS